MKLLIVDDSNIIRSRISRIIEESPQLGLKVVGVAENGRDAINMFNLYRPDLVTMDLTMPELDGVACIPELTKIKSDTKILVVSALADKATAIEALKRGAMGFIYKPFSEDEIKNALAEMMNDGDN